jgi:pyridoxamine 5'-phosphate oxidase
MSEPEHFGEGLSRRDLHPDPFEQFTRWLEEAKRAGIVIPEATALATADADGRPSVRTVLLKGLDQRGFAFYTNHGSRKARQLAQNPNAALTFTWKELDRQVCVTGTVARMSEGESTAYFRTRPREARLGAWASKQSAPISSREQLDGAFHDVEERFAGDDVPLPPHWGGYRLSPNEVEFWKGREHRLHDRFRYTREGEGWRIERLFP